MANNPNNLDFEELLSRDFLPAEVVCLAPRERFHPRDALSEAKNHHYKKKRRSAAIVTASSTRTAATATTATNSNKSEEEDKSEEEERARQRDFVLRLVAQTPSFRRHLSPQEEEKVLQDRDQVLTVKKHPKPQNVYTRLDFKFLPFTLADWESKINWEGVPETNTNQTNAKKDEDDEQQEPPLTDAQLVKRARAYLSRPMNPCLENLVLDDTTICWDGVEDAQKWASKSSPPLVLQLGVAGRSCADKIYLGLSSSSQRPAPANQQAAYQARQERESHSNTMSTSTSVMASAAHATKTKGSLHQDKQKLEAFIAARQEKRAQMAKEKTSRIAKAMDSLHLGGGRSRTITSSLMGPGGTERTGRPSRSMTGAYLEEAYQEQLDLIQNHSLVRDLSKVMLRQYHRPKLPHSVVRPDLSWQFQIRYAPIKKESTSAQVTSFISPHSGALAKAKFRSESDLSPSEGKLVLLEYSEERPPIQLVKGMRSKIVNYYRGDKAHCPLSAGGGDKPARKKRTDESASKAIVTTKSDRLPRLQGPDRETTVLDWVGKLPKKSKEKRSEEDAIDVLPEGVTEILHPKVHGPFIGEIDEGSTISALVSNLFVAPIFRHEPEFSDFLMVLTPPSGAARSGMREGMGVILRDFPKNIFTVGQTEPRQRINAPSSPDEKKFMGPFISYQIARALARAQSRDGNGLRLDEIADRVLPNAEIPSNALRQRLKQVATYDKNTQIWTPKQIGFEGYQGVEALSRSISPEAIVAYEQASAASRRLTDLGIHCLFSGDKTTVSVGVAMTYLSGQTVSARKLMSQIKQAAMHWNKINKNNKGASPLQSELYDKASTELQTQYKMLKEKHDIAQFIYEELQLAPWYLTGEFIDVHKKSEGSGMMQLSGLGDPSGFGEGFSFLRKVDNKPAKSAASSAANSELNAHVKKITGTEDDLRKLTMKQMATILRKFGNMDDKQITALKRWDRVHVIREISTRAASDRVGVGLERFARDEKFKLSEQKKDYRKKIQTIWKRQIASLSADATDKGGADADGAEASAENEARAAAQARKSAEADSDEDSDDDDFDFDDLLEEEMTGRPDSSGLDASRKSDGADGDAKDAHEFTMLMKQREEEKAAQEDFNATGAGGGKQLTFLPGGVKRKVIRRKITKTFPDGTQKTTFRFIVEPQEVGRLIAKLDVEEKEPKRKQEMKYQHGEDEKPPGHAMFEDEDDFEYSSKGRLSSGKRRGARRPGGRVPSRARGALQFGKLKQKVSKEDRARKRKREEDELEVYNAHAKRKTTNNRRERGSIRDRRPHVIFAERLEEIRAKVESRPHVGVFMKPVNRRVLPRYYEIISNPIDLSTMRDKISKYEYRTADALVKDFELMKNNAIKFNTAASPIAQEAIAIHEFVRDQVQACRSELTKLEDQVEDQMGGKSKKKRKEMGASTPSISIEGVAVNLGDLKGYDSGSGDDDEVFTGALGM